MDFKNFKFRCSALGKIVSKSGKFTDGNKTYIEEVFAGFIHNTQKQISSKYFEKGLFEEETGITLLNQTLYPGQLLVKNKERRENDFIHGEADTIKNGIVYDIKNAWDVFTFEASDLTHDYRWQLIGYMWLWECDKARLFYCLNNTPDHLLAAEERKMFYSGSYVSYESPDFIRDCEKLRAKHNYDAMPLEGRFKFWDIEKSELEIECLKNAIRQARNYLQQLWDEREARLKNNRRAMQPMIHLHDPELKTTVHETANL